MQTTLALAAAALAAVAYATPGGVSGDIAPTSPPPTGCSESYDGQFEITVVKGTTARRDLSKRSSTCGTPGYLTLTLAGGQLTDALGRTGYIASNYQFQFDAPPQAGAIYTGGFSVCPNGVLALGGSTAFFECLSGGFYNLYNTNWAAQCEPILIDILPCGSSSGVPATQAADGQPAGTTVGPAPVTQITDGQAQAQSAVPVSEFHDGQPQVVTGNAVTQITDGQVQAPTGHAVTQITDGQVQAPTGNAVTQITDGQVQAPTGHAVTQITDGQVQAPTGNAVTQITDGQVQAPTGQAVTQITDGQVQAPTGQAVTQITDGQIQAPTGKPVTQISDGQIQAPNATATPAPFTGAGNGLTVVSSFAALVMGIIAVILL